MGVERSNLTQSNILEEIIYTYDMCERREMINNILLIK